MTEDPDSRTFTPLTEWEDGSGPDESEDSEDAPETVLDRLYEELEPEQIHGAALTKVNGATYYVVVAMTGSNAGGAVLDLRTVEVDLGDETVRACENGLWVPHDPEISKSLTQLLGRATNDLTDSVDPDAPPAAHTAVEGASLDSLLSQPIRGDSREDSEETEESDSEATGVPEEIDLLRERLSAAGIGVSERFNKLQFGSKEPWDHELVGKDGLYGNYGVYCTAEDSLVIVDVDDPEEAPDLPRSFAVTSPHGSEERRHLFYKVPDWEEIHKTADKWNFKPSWGDVQVSNRYVVGPGCQLDAEGCDLGDHEAGEPGGCPECEDPDGGCYEIVDRGSIEEVPAVALIEVLRRDSQATVETGSSESRSEGRQSVDSREAPEEGATDPEADETDESDESGSSVECHECGRSLPESEASLLASDETREIWRCSGGCP